MHLVRLEATLKRASTLGYALGAVQAVFDAVSQEDSKETVGGNAVEVFGLTV